MRDNLPKSIRELECGIVNLDTNKGHGTHWVAYIKRFNNVQYYDSYGNLKPPIEIVNYFNSSGQVKFFYNHDRIQKFNTVVCGHFCLRFLYKNI